ncbi:MAG TPA: ABC transporter substrate-binding protein [Terriglobia bacterium]|nr:ABC transporter substrate-binding protein [Terriglobia bacterium]
MNYLVCPLLVASSAVLAVAPACAATRPRYGGALRVEIHAKVFSLDQEEKQSIAEADAANKIRDLIYDRLVRLDRNGQAQPALALSWEHDSQSVRWRFKLRPGVKWQDGAPLTPEEVAASLQRQGQAGSVRASGDVLEINLAHAWPDLPAALATDASASIRRSGDQSATALPVGTGPFRLSDWQPGHSAELQANDDYWGGRPFIDKIEIQMGRASREQVLDLELDRTDLAELDPIDAHRYQQEGKRVWASAAVELLLLHFDLNQSVVQDLRLRQAVARSIDRAAIQHVLTQNYGEVAGGFIPQWLSGYSFLFPSAPDLKLARDLTASIGTLPVLKMGYDPSDALARQTAERIAVNTRDAGMNIQVSPLPAGWKGGADSGPEMRMERVRIDGPTFENAVLQAESRLGLGFAGKTVPPEIVYVAEQKLLDNLEDVPVVYVPDLLGVGPHVKDWSALPWGDWRLQDAWMDAEKP